MASTQLDADPSSCFGFCAACQETHTLPTGGGRSHALALMQEFREIRRLDYLAAPDEADPRLAFDHLFQGERGHMFGVLECRDPAGRSVILRAFSSLHEGIRNVEGWVPPILSAQTYRDLVLPGQSEIKRLSRQMKKSDRGSPRHAQLFETRREISQQLMREIQSRYTFLNFRGKESSLRNAYLFSESIPGGVGECCAPKLLNHAARKGLKPVGIAEFYWDGGNPSGERRCGDFYPCCEARCRPILGFMLCGAQNLE